MAAKKKSKSRKKKMEYRVYIHQINQTYLDVTAGNYADAINKALRLWHSLNGPTVMSIEETRCK